MSLSDPTPNASFFQTNFLEARALRVLPGQPLRHFPEPRCLHLEFTSRGDRVPGRLLLPPTSTPTPYPLVLLVHGASGSKESPYIDATGGPWARAGAAVLAIDLPLHGARQSAKMTERLLEILAAPSRKNGGFSSILWEEFVRQAVIDLQSALDAAVSLEEIDSTRIAYASFSLGSILGGIFCGIDPRPRAAALAIGGGGFGPEHLDPTRYIGKFSPKPILFLGAERDERVPRVLTERLFEAAQPPKQIEWYDVDHGNLPGRALKRMWEFLRPELAL